MAQEDDRYERRRRRKRCFSILCISIVLILIITLITVLVVNHLPTKEDDLKSTFLQRCKNFNTTTNCEDIWDAFQKAFVNKNSCNISLAAYDTLVAKAPMERECNRAMLWSKSKDVVHRLTQKKNCFKTLEDTLLGSVLDGLTWCGKTGSDEILTTGCPRFDECENPVSSFWKQVSASFATAACGSVSVMLNGSIEKPFDSSSIFGSIEVPRLKPGQVTSLNVLLVVPTNPISYCSNNSLKELQNNLPSGIQYSCKEVPISRVEECISQPSQSCNSCW